MKIDDLLENVRTVGISGHIRPDGDCIGSCTGMAAYIRKNYPDIRTDVFLENIPESYRIIADTDKINTTYETDISRYDLFMVIDCGSERTGRAEPFFHNALNTVNIDHHISNTGTARVNHIEPLASSASELVYDVLDHDRMDVNIAKALYMGIICDTGVFKYSNTSPDTMCKAAQLISFGFDFGELIDHVFYEKSYIQNQILGRALLESTLFMDGRCIVATITQQTKEFYMADDSDLDGIVSQLMLTKKVSCAMLLSEIGSLEYKVSLRSDGNVDVAKIAGLFGGGGHMRAAGCTLNGTCYDVINNLSKYVEQQLDDKGTLSE